MCEEEANALARLLMPFFLYSMHLLNLGINPNKILSLGKKSPKLVKYRIFLD